MRKAVISLIGVAILLLAGGPAVWSVDDENERRIDDACDFLTGGGFIVRVSEGAPQDRPDDVDDEDLRGKATFRVAGGCKKGSRLRGHLKYKDRSTGLRVDATSITGYFFVETGDPTFVRIICGTATTNQFGNVDWFVLARESGRRQSGSLDEFFIRLRDQSGTDVYTTENDADRTLGGPGPGGGDITLHKPQPDFGFIGTCAAL